MLLQQAIEVEVAEYIERYAGLRGPDGLRQVVRNGSLPERDLVTGVGPLHVRQPRVHDRRPGKKFTSKILPPYLRRLHQPAGRERGAPSPGHRNDVSLNPEPGVSQIIDRFRWFTPSPLRRTISARRLSRFAVLELRTRRSSSARC